MRARVRMSRREAKELRRALKSYLHSTKEKKCEIWIGDGEVHDDNHIREDIDGLSVEQDPPELWPDVIPVKVKFYVEKEPPCS